MQAIILAGGLGTRLRDTVPDLPKPMAPINGRPFLELLLEQLIDAGFTTVILAVGYRHETIMDHFGSNYKSLKLLYSVEPEPLGTGGAIKQALEHTTDRNVFIINGDTYLEIDYQAMMKAHEKTNTALSVAIIHVPDVSRYGSLEIENNRIIQFIEKDQSGPGIINGGVYILSHDRLDDNLPPGPFSFETDLMMPYVRQLSPLAFWAEGTFIDIGIPEDYSHAQMLLGAHSARDNQP